MIHQNQILTNLYSMVRVERGSWNSTEMHLKKCHTICHHLGGRSATTAAFVDSSHGGDKRTRRSVTGYVIFVNRAPIIWYSKKQNTVESSTFSSEFIAMKTCVEHIAALRFKLRMFGMAMDAPTNVLCDNESVVKNSSKIESILHKKHSSIAYHAVRWAVAAGVVRVGWINTKENVADPFTKRLPAIKREYLFGNLTY